MPFAQLRRARVYTASHACLHLYSATQKPATFGTRIQTSFAPRTSNTFATSFSFTQHSQTGYVASAKEIKDQVTIGAYFFPEEFVLEAVRLGHPTEHSSLFPKEVRANVAYLSSKAIHQLAKERTEEVRRWVALSAELSHKENFASLKHYFLRLDTGLVNGIKNQEGI